MSMLAPELTFGTPDTISNDQGYFGPETITWRIHSDVMAVVGGVRALFLQALEPRAFGGVQAHSRYREEPFGRLLRTISHLKPIQVAYQLKYRLFLPRELSKYASEQIKYTKLNFYQLPDSNVESVKFNIEGVEFNFLNQSIIKNIV